MLDPSINMWETAEPVVRNWLRDELGPEALIADRIVEDTRTLLGLPDLIRRLEDLVPKKGGAPPAVPIEIVDAKVGGLWKFAGVAVVSAAVSVIATLALAGVGR